MYEAFVDDKAVGLSSKRIIFDSGSSLIYLPSSEYKVFMQSIWTSKGKTNCYEDPKE